MKHLSADDRLALIEAPGEPRHPHLTGCERCRMEVASARAVLSGARETDVPEPSPMFWDHFSARVSARIDAEPAADADRWRMPWRVLVPLSAAVAVMVMVVAVERGRPVAPTLSRVAAVVDEDVAASSPEDGGWLVLGDLAGEFDVETLGDSLGHALPGGAGSAVWQLNEQERAELTRLLQAEMPGGRSGS
jgi:hypothetical protein